MCARGVWVGKKKNPRSKVLRGSLRQRIKSLTEPQRG